ncbi:hypothetical protein Pmar_PMAR016401 [Perkinsus marinus ATCC 50983]|uniref:Uncharacterized protein n=1 Tax=Perkinsus marinus (strain ATCC 50983 / TXsc) TaxID=423536 RepID=C5L162_PERM5|nr:hypothetical protein Pmar_PMAR016401 [Perkinsus marinus ATCC 50983]EER09469.1 hypothetical protein Pmar_PMAR016401 [Perkinsus marinus ATCC 50983]|eukprot:XP_002777653.1 hypothetical protein Pmar_PMAR016401 [Perkinsus marinus ATCC 50983]
MVIIFNACRLEACLCLMVMEVTGTTQLDRSYSESRRTYHTAPAYDHLVTTYGGSNYYQQPHNYRDRIQAGIYEATVRKPVAYSHQRAAEENIPKRSNEVSPSLQKKYDSSSQEPDGEVDPPPIKDAGQGEDACISSQPELNASTREPNFPLGWSIASRFIPSGAVKREYDMSLSRPGSPSYKVRHEAIKFFQVLMSPETPHFQSVGEGWALNGFMYRLTRDDDVGVVLRQVEDPSKDGDTARILLSVITRDSRVGRGNTPKMTAAIDAWDFALRQLVSGATAQTVGTIGT